MKRYFLFYYRHYIMGIVCSFCDSDHLEYEYRNGDHLVKIPCGEDITPPPPIIYADDARNYRNYQNYLQEYQSEEIKCYVAIADQIKNNLKEKIYTITLIFIKKYGRHDNFYNHDKQIISDDDFIKRAYNKSHEIKFYMKKCLKNGDIGIINSSKVDDYYTVTYEIFKKKNTFEYFFKC